MFFLSFSLNSFHFSSNFFPKLKREAQNIKVVCGGEGQDHSESFPNHKKKNPLLNLQSSKTSFKNPLFILSTQQSCFSKTPGAQAHPTESLHNFCGSSVWLDDGKGRWLPGDGNPRGRRRSFSLPGIKFANHSVAGSVLMARGNERYLLADLTELENP